MRNVAIAAAAVLALAAPAAAEGANYFNGSTSHGASVQTSGHTIQHLELYCAGSGVFNREFAFSMANVISVSRKGEFSYSGIAYRYGTEHQPRGEYKVKLTGRLSGSRSVRIKWSLRGCGHGSVTADRAR
jgi:hypothetical protein